MKVTWFPFRLCLFLALSSSDTKKQARTATMSACDAAVLRVDPNRSQFFQYESVSVNCGQQGNSSDWRVKMNTSRYMNEECSTSWNETKESFCLIDTVYPSDSGVYWCESAAGESRDAVSITVTAGPVILESPALPVMEGDDVTLSCREESFSSNITADFYQDGLFIWRNSTGDLNIHSVSKHDEGLYKCSISGVGESAESRLTVRDSAGPDAPAAPVVSLSRLVWHAIVWTPYLLTTIILGLIYRDNRRALQLVAERRMYEVVVEMEQMTKHQADTQDCKFYI